MTILIDNDLTDLVIQASPDDLSILADHITAKGEGRISLSKEACEVLTAASLNRNFPVETRALISEELSKFGGNTIANFFRRGTGVSYREIVCDVADHVKATYSKNSSIDRIEMAILETLLEKTVSDMTRADREKLFNEYGVKGAVGTGPAAWAALIAAMRLAGNGAYQTAVLVANATATAFLGRGVAVAGTSVGFGRILGFLTGPIGWALTAAWSAYDLASPAYRVTVPCVIHIAYMRQKSMINSCPACGANVPANAKFCAECGHKVEKTAMIDG